jgi:hypothetical protein
MLTITKCYCDWITFGKCYYTMLNTHSISNENQLLCFTWDFFMKIYVIFTFVAFASNMSKFPSFTV